MIDTEGQLLGSRILERLEANGIAAENRTQFGPTKIVRDALLAGEIDIYPEYTGNGAFFHNVDADPVWRNAEDGYEEVKALDAQENGVDWLKPAPANNSWALAVRTYVAAEHDSSPLEDFAAWGNGVIGRASGWELVGQNV